jgi:ABC-2 type transport system permease protein
MARYPVGVYPGWLRLILTWVIPLGVITTLPAEALTGTISGPELAVAMGLAVGLVLGASVFFRLAVRRYSSASS